MAWCEAHGVGYVLGYARNERLRKRIAPQMEEAARLQQATGRRGSSPGSTTRPRPARGARRGVWWPRPSRLRARRIRAMWSPI